MSRWSMLGLVGVLVLGSPALADERPLRVDLFDTKSNRTGYVLVDPKTGRVDQFDLKSNRVGHGQLTPLPKASNPRPSSPVPAFPR